MKPRLGSLASSGLVVLLVATMVTVSAGGPVSASTASLPAGPITPVTTCPSLAGMDFSRVPDAPGRVTSSVVVSDSLGSQTVSFCDIKGVIAPQTHFEIKLPTATWHGQYLQEGCANLCGSVQAAFSDFPLTGFTCAAVLNGELALAADDEGHTGDTLDGSWAKDSLSLRIVFGLTSEHSLAQMSKAIIKAYYGQPASHSYYDGCSTGGREALILAQRYPDDFDGIIAGAPAGNLAPLDLFQAWLARSNTDAQGHQIVSAEKIPALHAAVLAACAGADGIIGDPRQCGFDPASIQCPPGVDTEACLTSDQVAAVRKFYRGPTDEEGRSLYNGGEPYGSELGWPGAFVQPVTDTAAPGDTYSATISLTYFKNMAFFPNPPDSFTLGDVRFTDREFRKLNKLGDAIYNANDPDLRAFAAHGGKLILYHGWADPAIPPWSTLDYYAAVERTMGGFAASQSFSRLYMVPGAYHCLFTPDFTSVDLADLLTPIISWVEDGVAPGEVEADTFSLTQQVVTFEQTVQPYDALAPVDPAPGSLNGHYDYIGTYSAHKG
jgi:Tannase and feruloyl esterase